MGKIKNTKGLIERLKVIEKLFPTPDDLDSLPETESFSRLRERIADLLQAAIMGISESRMLIELLCEHEIKSTQER